MSTPNDGLYLDSDGLPSLQESIVLYVDELGTSVALESMTDEDLRKVLEDHEELGWFLHSDTFGELERSARFSDNTVVGAPLLDSDDGGAFHQVFSAATYQLNLALRGRFLRGALARGPLYIGDGYVTGRGLLEAVKLEESEAIFPRVIIQRALWHGFMLESIPYMNPTDSPENRYVLIDADGELFVNYLAALAEDDDEGALEIGLVDHRSRIVDALATYVKSERIRRKYAWVAQYHNWICSEEFFDLPHLSVKEGLDHLEGNYSRRMSLIIPR